MGMNIKGLLPKYEIEFHDYSNCCILCSSILVTASAVCHLIAYLGTYQD